MMKIIISKLFIVIYALMNDDKNKKVYGVVKNKY